MSAGDRWSILLLVPSTLHRTTGAGHHLHCQKSSVHSMSGHADHTQVLENYNHHVNKVHTDKDRGDHNPRDEYSVQHWDACCKDGRKQAIGL